MTELSVRLTHGSQHWHTTANQKFNEFNKIHLNLLMTVDWHNNWAWSVTNAARQHGLCFWVNVHSVCFCFAIKTVSCFFIDFFWHWKRKSETQFHSSRLNIELRHSNALQIKHRKLCISSIPLNSCECHNYVCMKLGVGLCF